MSDQTGLAIQNNGVIAQTLDGMSRPLARQTKREIEYVAKRAIIAHAHEEARAQLCQGVMMNAAMLAMLEERLVQMAPLAATTLQAMTESYGIGACGSVMKW